MFTGLPPGSAASVQFSVQRETPAVTGDGSLHRLWCNPQPGSMPSEGRWMRLKQHKRTSARRSGRRASQAARRNLRPQQRPAVALPAVNHPEPVVSVIIPAMNEARTISAVIAGARGVHPRCEVIVIVNGSADNTAEIAQRMGAKVMMYAEPLGHDVGRSVGAEAARVKSCCLRTGIWSYLPQSSARSWTRSAAGLIWR